MAILKFLCDISDFDTSWVNLSTNGSYIDTTRVEYGYALTRVSNFMASWPEPAGNTWWFHYRHGQSTTDSAWDDLGALAFQDAAGNLNVRMDITDTLVRFNVFGSTTTSQSFAATAGSSRTFDVQLTKNGTTSLVLNVWVDGVQRVTNATVTNAVNFGLPVAVQTQLSDEISGGTFYFSECVVADEDTRGWRIRQHRTNAYGVFDEWDGSASVLASDARKNNGITTNTNDDRVSYILSNLSDIPGGAVINRVCVQSTLIRGSTGLANFNHFWRYDSGGVVIHDSDVAVSLTPTEYMAEYPTSPNTGVAWTQSEMQDLQVGVRGRT